MQITESNSGWRALLTYGVVYKLVQFVFREKRSKQLILDDFILPAGSNCKVLDMGCGPGNILKFLPENIRYVGFDLSSEYISMASENFKSRHGATFICGSASDMMCNQSILDQSIDVVIVHGVFHHVSDDIVSEMFDLARVKLKPNGKMVAIEPVWFQGQSRLRRWVMSKDRGNNIKTDKDWARLFADLSKDWGYAETKIYENLTRFYDLVVLSLTKNH